MLRFVNSGLSQTEVRRAHALRSDELVAKHVWRVLTVAIVTGVSIAVLTELFLGMIAAVIVSIIFGMLSVAIAKRIAAEVKVMHNDAVPVRVIRAGLVRQVTVGELVEHDVLLLHAGEVVPVDVEANGMQLQTGIYAPADIIGTVTAVGNNRSLVRQLSVQGRSITVSDVQTVLQALVAAYRAVLTMPRIVRSGINFIQHQASRFVRMAAKLLNAGPVGNMHVDSRRLAVAFVNNQGTIATSPVRHSALPS